MRPSRSSKASRAIASRSLSLREMRAETVEETESAIVQAVLESSTRDPALMGRLADELRAVLWIDSIDWTETDSES